MVAYFQICVLGPGFPPKLKTTDFVFRFLRLDLQQLLRGVSHKSLGLKNLRIWIFLFMGGVMDSTLSTPSWSFSVVSLALGHVLKLCARMDKLVDYFAVVGVNSTITQAVPGEPDLICRSCRDPAGQFSIFAANFDTSPHNWLCVARRGAQEPKLHDFFSHKIAVKSSCKDKFCIRLPGIPSGCGPATTSSWNEKNDSSCQYTRIKKGKEILVIVNLPILSSTIQDRFQRRKDLEENNISSCMAWKIFKCCNHLLIFSQKFWSACSAWFLDWDFFWKIETTWQVDSKRILLWNCKKHVSVKDETIAGSVHDIAQRIPVCTWQAVAET